MCLQILSKLRTYKITWGCEVCLWNNGTVILPIGESSQNWSWTVWTCSQTLSRPFSWLRVRCCLLLRSGIISFVLMQLVHLNVSVKLTKHTIVMFVNATEKTASVVHVCLSSANVSVKAVKTSRQWTIFRVKSRRKCRQLFEKTSDSVSES